MTVESGGTVSNSDYAILGYFAGASGAATVTGGPRRRLERRRRETGNARRGVELEQYRRFS